MRAVPVQGKPVHSGKTMLFQGKPFQGGRLFKGRQRPKAAPIRSSDANPREAMPSQGQAARSMMARPVQGKPVIQAGELSKASQFIQVGTLFRGKPFQGGRLFKGRQRPSKATAPVKGDSSSKGSIHQRASMPIQEQDAPRSGNHSGQPSSIKASQLIQGRRAHPRRQHPSKANQPAQGKPAHSRQTAHQGQRLPRFRKAPKNGGSRSGTPPLVKTKRVQPVAAPLEKQQLAAWSKDCAAIFFFTASAGSLPKQTGYRCPPNSGMASMRSKASLSCSMGTVQEMRRYPSPASPP